MTEAKLRKKKEYKSNGTWGKHRGDRAAQSARYRLKHSAKRKCHLAVFAAKQKELITAPQYCENCNRKKPLFAHHGDYLKPLEINWLCQDCHNLWHGIIKKHKGEVNE